MTGALAFPDLVLGAWNLLDCPRCGRRCALFFGRGGDLGPLYTTSPLALHGCTAVA